MNLLRTTLLVGIMLTCLLAPARVSAHVLAEDNGVSAVLHIPPFDAPQAGVPTSLEFQFGTDNGAFQIADYNVKVVVTDDAGTVATTPVTAPYLGAASLGTASVQFPVKAAYDIQLSGMPKTTGEPAFMMRYIVRVASSNTATAKPRTTNAAQTVYIGGVVLVLFVMFTARQLVNGGRYSNKDNQEKKHG